MALSLRTRVAVSVPDQRHTHRFLHWILVLPLVGSAVGVLIWSWNWPLVGDASLMHYVVFLIHSGLIPYRDIVDINLPGTYLFEAGAVRLLGPSALAWRLYDVLLVLCTGLGYFVMLKRRNMLVTFLAAGMLLIIHAEDGMAQLGQRDLVVAALVVWGYALLFRAQDHRPGRLLLFCSFACMGLSLTIKPTFLPLYLFLIGTSSESSSAPGSNRISHLAYSITGLLFPPLCVVAWLGWFNAVPSFWQTLTILLPLHAELGRRSLGYLTTHALAPLAPVCIVWLVLLLWTPKAWTVERTELIAGLAMGFGAYVLQGKGYPYHRYPLLAVLLPMMNGDFVQRLGTKGAAGVAAVFAVIVQCFIVAPHAAWLVRSFEIQTPFQSALAKSLSGLDLPLEKQVQCLDTFGGCIATLNDLRLVQSTGFLYDCYLFSPGNSNTNMLYRQAFWKAFQAAKPQIVVVTDQFCFGESGGFSKLARWPALQQELSTQYREHEEWHPSSKQHWWSRREFPAAFRIYIRNP